MTCASCAVVSVSLDTARVLVVGIGGLGCPAASVLATAGIGTLVLVDDDRVAIENLHRQTLFTDDDVGALKVEVAKRRLEARAPGLRVEARAERFLPATARALLERCDVVVEGSDNFPTKFLVADSSGLARVPVVHGAALSWIGTVMTVGASGRPCYRCVFEDLPAGEAPTCATAGVVGPVVGVVGAVMADRAIGLLRGSSAHVGEVLRFDGRSAAPFRAHRPRRRRDCPLCGDSATFTDLSEARYRAPRCEAP